ncbi:hypothetical protein MJK72_04845 [Klebsiella pneumoniae]|nr:hypothetical protein MJK72_04845 [Klebsiella pneumoniae]
MTGYQEILTDPSYSRQIVTLIYPHMLVMSAPTPPMKNLLRYMRRGLVIRDPPLIASNFRSTEDLFSYLKRHNIVAIADIDTRKLTRSLREKGAQNGCIIAGDSPDAPAGAGKSESVPRPERHGFGERGSGPPQKPIAGRKAAGPWRATRRKRKRKASCRSIALRHMTSARETQHPANAGWTAAAASTVVPAKTSAADVLALNPNGIFPLQRPWRPGAVRLRYRGD